MATKSFDAALDFLPEVKTTNKSAGLFNVLKAIVEAFDEGRAAEAKYRELVAHGMRHDLAARQVFELTSKH